MGGHPSCTRLRSKHLYLLSFLKQNLGLFLTGFFHLPSPQGHFYISWFLCPEDYCSVPTGLSVWILPFELPLNYRWGPQPPGSLLGGVSKEGPNTEWPGNSLSFIAQPYLESLKQSLKRNPWRKDVLDSEEKALRLLLPAREAALWAADPSVYWRGSATGNHISNKISANQFKAGGKR